MDAIEIKRGDSFDYGVEIPSEFADGHFVGWTVARYRYCTVTARAHQIIHNQSHIRSPGRTGGKVNDRSPTPNHS